MLLPPNPPVAPPLPNPPEVEVLPPNREPPEVLLLVVLLFVLPKPPKVEPVLPLPNPKDMVAFKGRGCAGGSMGEPLARCEECECRESEVGETRAAARERHGVCELAEASRVVVV